MAKTKQTKTKAFQILEKSKSKGERVESFYDSTKRNLLRSVIDSKINEIEKLKDRIFELSDFSLETNLNSGLSALSREETERRFKEIMALEYQLELLNLELKAKYSIYVKYFGDDYE